MKGVMFLAASMCAFVLFGIQSAHSMQFEQLPQNLNPLESLLANEKANLAAFHAMLPGSEDEAPSGCQEPREATAVIITGMASRFVYNDSFVNLPKPGGFYWLYGINETSCPLPLDVYVLLQIGGGKGVRPFKRPYPALPPYWKDAFSIDLLKNFYKSMGARRVTIEYIHSDAIDTVRDDAIRHFKNESSNPERWWNRVQSSDSFKRRWPSNPNMIFVRHMAHKRMKWASRMLPYNYSHVLYLREDNCFLPSTPRSLLSHLTKIVDTRSKSELVVAVDSVCNFDGVNDKIFLANVEGARFLWGETIQDFLEHMTNWLEVKSKDYTKPFSLKTEKFYEKLFKYRIDAIKVNFYRTDLRYVSRVKGEKVESCIPSIYAKCLQGKSNATDSILIDDFL